MADIVQFQLWRVMSGNRSTVGVLYRATPARRPLCFTLEDRFRPEKVDGETEIPPGTYTVELRTEGGMHAKYLERFGSLHHGMLWIRNVHGFEYVYLHCGNTDEDTRGCVLLGDNAVQSVTQAGALQNSEAAYRRVYPEMSSAILAGNLVRLQITMLDTPPGVT